MSNIVTVNFRNDTLFAVERDDGVFVAVKPISDALGLNWSGQHRRLNDDPVLAEGICVIHMPSVGGVQETVCIKLELVNGWLFKIDSRRVKDDETRQKVLQYQRECYQVLFEHFYGKTKAKPEIQFDDDSDAPESMKIRMVSEARQVYGVHAAGELWFKLGLPVTPAMVSNAQQLSFVDYRNIRTADTA